MPPSNEERERQANLKSSRCLQGPDDRYRENQHIYVRDFIRDHDPGGNSALV